MEKKIKKIGLVLVPLLFFASMSFAIGGGAVNIITVKAGDGSDLKQAIEVSANVAGTIIELPAGTYILDSEIAWPNIDNIMIRATSGASSANVIISANTTNTNRFATVAYAVNLNIDNVTIQNFGGNSWNNNGGVFYLENNAHFI